MPETKEQTEEHPIIFSGWSIRRILADEKSETRRIVKPQPEDGVQTIHHDGDGWYAGTMNSEWDPVPWEEKCPFGKPGDVIWVREAFRLPAGMDYLSPSGYVAEKSGQKGAAAPICRYEADGAFLRAPELEMAYERDAWGRKRPSIYMPRELCRLRLRVEDVRVERLQAITEADAVAEGIPKTLDLGALDFEVVKHAIEDLEGRVTPRLAFRSLWESIHGDGAWSKRICGSGS